MRMQACFQALRKMFQAGTKPDHAARSDVTPIQPQPPPSAALHEFLEALGEDAMLLLILLPLPLHTKRSLACTDAWLYGLVMPYLRAPELTVTTDDATSNNAAFLERLPSLRVLHVDDRELHIEYMRTESNVNIVGLGAPAAFFLGAVFGGSVRVFHLAARVLDAGSLRTCLQLDTRSMPRPDLGILCEADIELMRGIMWRNPHLNLDATLAQLRQLQMHAPE